MQTISGKECLYCWSLCLQTQAVAAHKKLCLHIKMSDT